MIAALSDRIPALPAASALCADSFTKKQRPTIPLNAYCTYRSSGERLQQPMLNAPGYNIIFPTAQ